MKAAIWMFVYAAGLLIGGITAYTMAPAGANAVTALVIPGACAAVMIACGLMARRIGVNRKVGMIGIHAGLVLPLVFALVLGFQAFQRTKSVARHPDVAAEYQAALREDPGLQDAGRRREFFKSRGTADHDATYLRNTLWALSAWSLIAFVGILSTRPKPEARSAGPDAGGAA